MFGMVFCLAVLADLYHAEPMAFYMSAMNEPDNIFIGEPAVSQYIAEPYAPFDSPLYHIFGKFYLGHVVFLLPLTEHLADVFGGMSTFEFFVAHAVIAFLSLLPDDGEVEKNLRYPIGDRHTETFETQHRLVGKMRMDSSYFLDSPACLLVVGIVKNQTNLVGLMVSTVMYPVPQLYRYMPRAFRQFMSGFSMKR